MLQDRRDRKRGYFRHPFARKMLVVLETLRADTRDSSPGQKPWLVVRIGIVRDLLIHFTGKINATIALRG
jgi:hypothetical protein